MSLVGLANLSIAVFWLAYSNGANDNFKGVATLYGSSSASFKRALLWATIATAAGSIMSVFAAERLLKAFSGKGVVPDDLIGTPQLLIAVAAAAAATIFLATYLGLPTSTTHALAGALIGIALTTSIAGTNLKSVLYGFAAPLLLSPVFAITLAAASYLGLRRLRAASGITKQTCLCIGHEAPQLVQLQANGSAVLADSGLIVSVDQVKNCVERYEGKFIGISAQKAIESVHYLSAGAVCFSRAVNDTPKIAALLIAFGSYGSYWPLGIVATAMTVGGLLSSRRVAETMSRRITDLNPGQGLSANLITSALVLTASQFGLPVSTTHVSCGSIFGIGLTNRSCRWKVVAEIVLAWVTTLPLAALLGAALFLLVRELV